MSDPEAGAGHPACLPEQLARLVAASPASLIQPARPRQAPIAVSPPLRLTAALGLGPGRWVTVITDASGARWTVPVIDERGQVRRALPGDGVAEALIALACQGGPAPGEFGLRHWTGTPVRGERPLAAAVDQTNESVIVGVPPAAPPAPALSDPPRPGSAAVVKWLVHQPPACEAAEHPAVSRLTALAMSGFGGTPAPWALLTCDIGERAPLLLATITAYLPGAEDGWDWAVRDLRSLAAGQLEPARALAPAATLGGLTARLHAALAPGGHEMATEKVARSWVRRAETDLAQAVRLVDGPEGRRLAALAPRIAAEIAALAGMAGTPLIDVHGDLHVGQVLRYGPGPSYAINDFDGNPVLPEAERASRQPAAIDVAGMLASLDHVGRIVLRRGLGAAAQDSPAHDSPASGAPGRDGPGSAAAGHTTRIVEDWIGRAQAAFLDSYRAGLRRDGLGWLLDERLIRPLRAWQECREYLYAIRHLPDWRYVPDLALAALFPDREDE